MISSDTMPLSGETKSQKSVRGSEALPGWTEAKELGAGTEFLIDKKCMKGDSMFLVMATVSERGDPPMLYGVVDVEAGDDQNEVHLFQSTPIDRNAAFWQVKEEHMAAGHHGSSPGGYQVNVLGEELSPRYFNLLTIEMWSQTHENDRDIGPPVPELVLLVMTDHTQDELFRQCLREPSKQGLADFETGRVRVGSNLWLFKLNSKQEFSIVIGNQSFIGMAPSLCAVLNHNGLKLSNKVEGSKSKAIIIDRIIRGWAGECFPFEYLPMDEVKLKKLTGGKASQKAALPTEEGGASAQIMLKVREELKGGQKAKAGSRRSKRRSSAQAAGNILKIAKQDNGGEADEVRQEDVSGQRPIMEYLVSKGEAADEDDVVLVGRDQVFEEKPAETPAQKRSRERRELLRQKDREQKEELKARQERRQREKELKRGRWLARKARVAAGTSVIEDGGQEDFSEFEEEAALESDGSDEDGRQSGERWHAMLGWFELYSDFIATVVSDRVLVRALGSKLEAPCAELLSLIDDEEWWKSEQEGGTDRACARAVLIIFRLQDQYLGQRPGTVLLEAADQWRVLSCLTRPAWRAKDEYWRGVESMLKDVGEDNLGENWTNLEPTCFESPNLNRDIEVCELEARPESGVRAAERGLDQDEGEAGVLTPVHKPWGTSRFSDMELRNMERSRAIAHGHLNEQHNVKLSCMVAEHYVARWKEEGEAQGGTKRGQLRSGRDSASKKANSGNLKGKKAVATAAAAAPIEKGAGVENEAGGVMLKAETGAAGTKTKKKGRPCGNGGKQLSTAAKKGKSKEKQADKGGAGKKASGGPTDATESATQGKKQDVGKAKGREGPAARSAAVQGAKQHGKSAGKGRHGHGDRGGRDERGERKGQQGKRDREGSGKHHGDGGSREEGRREGSGGGSSRRGGKDERGDDGRGAGGGRRGDERGGESESEEGDEEVGTSEEEAGEGSGSEEEEASESDSSSEGSSSSSSSSSAETSSSEVEKEKASMKRGRERYGGRQHHRPRSASHSHGRDRGRRQAREHGYRQERAPREEQRHAGRSRHRSAHRGREGHRDRKRAAESRWEDSEWSEESLSDSDSGSSPEEHHRTHWCWDEDRRRGRGKRHQHAGHRGARARGAGEKRKLRRGRKASDKRRRGGKRGREDDLSSEEEGEGEWRSKMEAQVDTLVEVSAKNLHTTNWGARGAEGVLLKKEFSENIELQKAAQKDAANLKRRCTPGMWRRLAKTAVRMRPAKLLEEQKFILYRLKHPNANRNHMLLKAAEDNMHSAEEKRASKNSKAWKKVAKSKNMKQKKDLSSTEFLRERAGEDGCLDGEMFKAVADNISTQNWQAQQWLKKNKLQQQSRWAPQQQQWQQPQQQAWQQPQQQGGPQQQQGAWQGMPPPSQPPPGVFVQQPQQQKQMPQPAWGFGAHNPQRERTQQPAVPWVTFDITKCQARCADGFARITGLSGRPCVLKSANVNFEVTPTSQALGGTRPNSGACYNCNTQGHYGWECPMLRGAFSRNQCDKYGFVKNDLVSC